MTARCACYALTLREQALPSHPVRIMRKTPNPGLEQVSQEDSYLNKLGAGNDMDESCQKFDRPID